jgi:hypothetical protein
VIVVLSHVQSSARGGKFVAEYYRLRFHEGLERAGISGYVRAFHDLRHVSLTNGAAAGE